MKKPEMISDRLQSKPCMIGLLGKCCRNCLMGPCILAKPNDKGICGANIDVVTSRNILRFVAGGTASHCGHAWHMLGYAGRKYAADYIEKKAPRYLHELWTKLNIVPKIHFEHFKDISEALHASTMGADADYRHLLGMAMKLGIIDGYFGMYLATELEDREFGKPSVRKGYVDLGVIKPEKVNIAVHGHFPALAEALAKEMQKKENSDINLVGVCCSGSSILARHGIPLAANFILQEQVIASGCIDVMAVDLQCIMPSLADLAECYHTKLITTNEICRMPNVTHMPVSDRKSAIDVARRIIALARINRHNRNKEKISLSNVKAEAVVGFSEHNLPLAEWAKMLAEGKIKGIIAAIGCENPRVRENWIDFYRELSKDYIILTTGCIAFKLASAGLLDGKRFFHLGSCVNNSRIAEIFKRIVDILGKQITDLPFLISCPMPITEKAIAIGFFFAALGVDVHFGYPFLLTSDTKIADFLKNLLKKDFRSKIFVEMKPDLLLAKIRKEGLSDRIKR
jgi:carbon-monoxide dehydrogenase catalytic subunit